MKKLFSLSVLVLLLFVLFGCRSEVPDETSHIEQPAEEIISEPITQPEAIAQVYEQPIVLNEISFTFENREIEPRHAERVDIIRSGVIEYFNLHRRPSHVVFTNDERSEIGHNSVRINPDSPLSLGAIFHFIDGGIRPAWISAGLELYFAVSAGASQFEVDDDVQNSLARLPYAPDDAWFVYGFFPDNDEMRRDALTISYHFTAYLIQHDLLSPMVMSYFTNETAAEELRAQAWLSFSGLELDNSTIYRYRFDLYESEFTVFTERGRYTFMQAGYWVNTPIHEYNQHIELLDSGVAFAFDFFEIEQAELITFSLYPGQNPFIPIIAGVVPPGLEIILMWRTLNTMGIGWAVTHEVVHYITQRYFPAPFSGWAEEGLATAIGYIHASVDDVFRAYNLGRYGTNENNWQPLAAQEALLQLSEADTMQDVCPIATLNFIALWQLTYFDVNDEYFPYFFQWPFGGRPNNPHDIPDGVLFCYSTSGSFAMFLLEIGNLEDYMQFRSDRDAAQEIYGMDLYQLIEMWKYEHLQFDYWRGIFSEFLMDYIENLLSFWESFREAN